MTRLVSPRIDGTEQLELSLRGAPRDDMLLLPRGEYDVYVMDVPPVDERELDAAIPQRLRTLYPGSLETTELDHRRNGDDTRTRILFVADRKVLDRYRGRKGPRKFAASALLLLPFARKGPWIGVIWGGRTYERCVFDGESLRTSERMPRGPDPTADFAELSASSARQELPMTILVLGEAEGDESFLIGSARKVSESIRVELLSRSRAPIAQTEIFSRAGRRRSRPGPVLVRILAALDLLLVALSFGRLASLRELQLSSVKEKYVALRAENGERAEKTAELRRWEERLAALEAGRGPDCYVFVAELSTVLGRGCRIRNLTIQGDLFTVEAEGPDGLGALARLEKAPSFAEVRLHQSIPLESGRGERFSLSGRYGDDRP